MPVQFGGQDQGHDGGGALTDPSPCSATPFLPSSMTISPTESKDRFMTSITPYPAALGAGFNATIGFSHTVEVGPKIISVPTPRDGHHQPALSFMKIVDDKEKGADIAYSDPHVPVFPRKRDYQFDLTWVPLTADNISSYDCILIATDHDAFDHDALVHNARLMVDTRGRIKAGRNVVLA